MIKYALTFIPQTCRYCCHATTCSAYVKTRRKVRLPQEFDSVAQARIWADADETEKTDRDKPVVADFVVCPCAKIRVDGAETQPTNVG